jgi:hypothetical protein
MDADAAHSIAPGPDIAPEALGAFIARWERAGGTERANYQLFLTELFTLPALPLPDPAREDNQDNAYVFERRVVSRSDAPAWECRLGRSSGTRRRATLERRDLLPRWSVGARGLDPAAPRLRRSRRRRRSHKELRRSHRPRSRRKSSAAW